MPSFASVEEFEQTPRQLETYRAAFRAIGRQHQISFATARLFEEASAVVASLDERVVVKLFHPTDRDHARAEAAVLSFLQPVDLPTPRLLGQGELDGWPYVIMNHLPGRPLLETWEQLPEEDRLRLLEELATRIRALHSAGTKGLSLPWPAWDQFLATRHGRSLEHHRGTGLAEAWCEQIPDFLNQQQLRSRTAARLSLLHTEIMPQHLLVTTTGGRWQISGFVDFEPSMFGDPEYEWASVALFFTQGVPGRLGTFLRHYGYAPSDLDHQLQLRLLGYLLLHRYSRLPWYFEFMPVRTTVLADLAESWFRF